MAAANSVSSFFAELKELYTGDAIPNMVEQDNVLFGIIKKEEDWEGKYVSKPVALAAGQGISADFPTAQAMSLISGDTHKQFQILPVIKHSLVTVSTEVILASMSSKGAFLKATTSVIDNGLKNFANNISRSIYRGADGTLAQISSATNFGSSTLILATPADADSFNIGDQLDVVSSTTASAIEARGTNGHGLYISAVDRIGGKLSVAILPQAGATPCNINDSANGVPSAASGYYLVKAGDYGAPTARKLLSGYQSWVPLVTPTSGDSFFGVDRSVDPVYLAGQSLDATSLGLTLMATLEIAIANVQRVGGTINTAMMNPVTFGKLNQELMGKQQLTMVDKPDGRVGYEGIKIVGATGPVVCLPDRTCPSNMIACMDKDKWVIGSVGKVVDTWDLDGRDSLRQSAASGIEVRFVSYANMYCEEPRCNVNIKINP